MAHRDRLADLPRRTGLSQSDEDEEELGRAVVAECGRKFPLPGSAQRPDHREPTQRGLASAVHFEVALALASAAPMTESGKIDNRTRREFTLIGYVTGRPQTSRSARSASMGTTPPRPVGRGRSAATCAVTLTSASYRM